MCPSFRITVPGARLSRCEPTCSQVLASAPGGNGSSGLRFCLLVGPLGIRLAAEEPAVGGEAARDRDGAVAREGADLDGPARAEEAREHGDTFRERANSRHRWSPTLRGEPSPL